MLAFKDMIKPLRIKSQARNISRNSVVLSMFSAHHTANHRAIRQSTIQNGHYKQINGANQHPNHNMYFDRVKDLITQSSIHPRDTDTRTIHKILSNVELFDYCDSNSHEYDDNEVYLSTSQQTMMDKLIAQANTDLHDHMNPFYMVDLGDVLRKHMEWISLLPSVHPFYAVKCNPDPLIISLLDAVGCSFDCASKGEFDLLMANGVDIKDKHGHDKVIFSHSCKHPLHLQYASEIGINLCTFDNEYEIEKIHQFHPSCKALLRIQVDDSQSICKFNSKYGYNVDDIKDIYRIFELCQKYNINLNGIMFHVGSGCLDSNVYKTAIEKSKFLFDVAHSRFGFDSSVMNVLDLGGGFPGINDKNSIHFKQIARVINEGLEYHFDANEYKFVAEPGRYYVSKSHSLICDIIAKKKSQSGFMYYINEGMYGSFNCMYFDHAEPIIIPYKSNNGNKYKSTIFGPTCDSMDKMYDAYWLPEMNIMDKMIIPNFGAYTGAASSGFNGFQKSKSRYVMTL